MGKMKPAVGQAASSKQGGYAINGDMNRGHASPPRQPYIEVPGLRRPPTYLVPKLKRHSSNAPLLAVVLCAVLCCAALLAGLMVHAPGLEPGLGLSSMNEAIKDGLGVSSCRAEPAIFRPFCAGCLTMTSAEEGSVRFNGSVDE